MPFKIKSSTKDSSHIPGLVSWCRDVMATFCCNNRQQQQIRLWLSQKNCQLKADRLENSRASISILLLSSYMRLIFQGNAGYV